MNKKILIIGFLAVFTLVAISLVSAINTSTATAVEKKDSPLFGMRTRRAIGDRLQDLRESIKTRFIGERVFFLPFSSLRKLFAPGLWTKETEGCPPPTDCMETTCDSIPLCDTTDKLCTGVIFC